MRDKHTFATLPGEIQNHIAAYLSCLETVALRYVNRHFYRTVPLPEAWMSDSSIGTEYLHDIETSTWHRRKEDFACYSCFVLKPRLDFTTKQTRGKQGKHGGKWWRRLCLQCFISQDVLKPGSILSTKGGMQSQILCRACSKLQREWCTRCTFCRTCLLDWNPERCFGTTIVSMRLRPRQTHNWCHSAALALPSAPLSLLSSISADTYEYFPTAIQPWTSGTPAHTGRAWEKKAAQYRIRERMTSPDRLDETNDETNDRNQTRARQFPVQSQNEAVNFDGIVATAFPDPTGRAGLQVRKLGRCSSILLLDDRKAEHETFAGRK
ncbi:MAG: hypothetical protein Q9224_000683 [Gallowayella concinna]